MKNLILFLIPLMMVSCSSPEEKKTETVTEQFSQNETTKNFDTEKLKGRYTGPFGKGIIVLQINYVQGKNASGFNILRGNRRNIKGNVENKGDHFHFVLKEPGDDQYDGVFEIDIDTSSLSVNGKWTPNDLTKTDVKEFKLKKLAVNDSSSIIGFYSGNIGDLGGMLEIKKNGICTFEFSVENQKNGEREWIEKTIHGTWIENGKNITLEFENNPYLEFYRMTLKNVNEEYGDFLDGGEKVSFYSGF